MLERRVPDPAHRHLGRGDGAPRAPGRAGLGGAAADAAAGSPSTARATGCRGWSTRCWAAASAARSSRCAPTDVTADRGAERRGRWPRSRAGSTWRWSRCRPPTSAEVVIDVAHKGAHGIVVLTGHDVGPGDNQTVINLARAYGVRALGPDALGLINTDEVELNATPGPMPRTGGVGLFCQSAAVGVAVLNHAVRADLGPVVVHQHRRLRRRDRQRRDAVLGGRRRHPGLPAVAGLDRQPAQVLPDHPPADPAQAGRGVRPGPDQPSRRMPAYAAAWGMRPTRRSTPCSGRPG